MYIFVRELRGGISMPESTNLPLVTETTVLEELRLKANNCIKNHVIAAMGVGLVPSFWFEAIGVTGIEVKLIRDLAKIYDFPIPGELVAYKILISVIFTIAPFYLASKMKSAVKGVPLLGHITYITFLSASSGVAVYAVGKIFQEHYESGGSFISQNNRYLKKFFKEKYAEGEKVVPTYVAEAC